MIVISCKCLNVSATVLNAAAGVAPAFCSDCPTSCSVTSTSGAQEFLKECIGPYTNAKDLRIETKHESLTQRAAVQITPSANKCPETWSLVRCSICDLLVYGTRTHEDQLLLILNAKLQTTPDAINYLKLDDHYSKFFKVVVRPATTAYSSSAASLSDGQVCRLVNKSDARLKPLQMVLNERLRRETERVEENIRKYTAEQFNLLHETRQVAEREFALLASKVSSEYTATPPSSSSACSSLSPNLLLFPGGEKKLISISVSGGSLLETPPLTPDSGHDNSCSPPRLLSAAGGGAQRSLAISLNSNNNNNQNQNSLSAWNRGPSGDNKSSVQRQTEAEEDFFGDDVFFPGAIDRESVMPHVYGHDDEDDEEDDDEDEYGREDGEEAIEATETIGKEIPMMGSLSSSAMCIAKSLPIATPALAIQDRRSAAQNEESGHGLDIAASIQALAKSVHGSDAIFGDLPRPRLSTQI